MKKTVSLLVAFAMLVIMIPAVFVSAADDVVIYVGSNGDDANNGLTIDKAVKTLAKAAQLVDDKTSSLTVKVLPDTKFDMAAADSIPMFPCPVTITSADKSNKASMDVNFRLKFFGDITIDDMIININFAQFIEPQKGAEITIGAGNEIIEISNKPSVLGFGDNPADITILTGEWFYIYPCGGTLTIGGDTSADIISSCNANFDGTIEEANIIIDTTGNIGNVYAGGVPGPTNITKTTTTVINGTINKFVLGAHAQTDAGVAMDSCKSGKTDEAVLNICGGEFIGPFTFEGDLMNKFSDGSEYNRFPPKITLNLYSDKGKAAYEAISDVTGTAPTPNYFKEDRPAEKPDVKPDEKPDVKPDKQVETGDFMVIISVILGITALAGAVTVRKAGK